MTYIKKLGLGTVQWGLPYGISNKEGQTSLQEVHLILNEARRLGIKLLDTAPLYGTAESILGKNDLTKFKVITKTPSFNSSNSNEEKVNLLSSTFYESLKNLSVSNIYGLLVHHANDILNDPDGHLISFLKELQFNGFVEKLGVSIYDGQQLDAILKVFKPDIVQLPLNVLDQRLVISGHIDKLKNLGVEIHVRSVFLQGLLLTPIDQINNYFSPIHSLLVQWHKAAAEQGLLPVQAALSYVRDMTEVDTVLVGVENLKQLQECHRDFSINKTFNPSGLSCNDPKFVNPSLWKVS